jgi:hypothetical protein
VHHEATTLLFAGNTLALGVSFRGFHFHVRYPITRTNASSILVIKALDFPKAVGGARIAQLVRRAVVTVEVVDDYTGGLKYNVSGPCLVDGYKQQVARLAHMLPRWMISLEIRLVWRAETKQTETGRKPLGQQVQQVQEVLSPLGNLRATSVLVERGVVEEGFAEELEARIRGERGRVVDEEVSQRIKGREMSYVDSIRVGAKRAPLIEALPSG